MNIIGKYTIEEEIGKGKFGTVYKGTKIKDQERIAIKIETNQDSMKILKHETSILNYLHRNKCEYIPTVYWFGIYETFPTLVMTYYKNSLDDYVKYKTITPKKLDHIMSMILGILEQIHKHYVIHRDIKPQNIMMKDGELYIIDFGFATFYLDENNEHMLPNEMPKEFLLGTPKYMSYYIHEGMNPSRRDDLISLGYLYINIAISFTESGLNDLPWSVPCAVPCAVPCSNIQTPATMQGMSTEFSRSPTTLRSNVSGSLHDSSELLRQSSPELPRSPAPSATARSKLLDKIPINHISHPKNRERGRLKSWENIAILCKKDPNLGKIGKFLERCYNLKYDETIDYGEWTQYFHG